MSKSLTIFIFISLLAFFGSLNAQSRYPLIKSKTDTTITNFEVLINMGMALKIDTADSNYYLRQYYPSPFGSTPSITVATPDSTILKIEIKNVMGEVVRHLCDSMFNNGIHEIIWDYKDDKDEVTKCGIYVFVCEAFQVMDSVETSIGRRTKKIIHL